MRPNPPPFAQARAHCSLRHRHDALVFDVQLANAVQSVALPREVAQTVLQHRGMLAGIPTPAELPDATTEARLLAIREAFVAGFRIVTGLYPALALLGAFCAWV